MFNIPGLRCQSRELGLLAGIRNADGYGLQCRTNHHRSQFVNWLPGRSGGGGNSQSCDFGISTWFRAALKMERPFRLICMPIWMRPVMLICCRRSCTNGVDDDEDGLVDCYDSDCAPQLLQNQSFENTGNTVFNTTFEGSPAIAL
ncbi:MAG: hypothetical protein R2788_03615 [Saprospiraceae bacterium]